MMPVEGFEALARICPETVTLGLINGELEVQPVPDGDHGEIITWVAMQCVQQQPELRLYGQRGLRIGGDRNGRARPDGTLARVGRFAGDGPWSNPDRILMTVDVASYDESPVKACGYAAAGIPLRLLIDHRSGTLAVHSEPGPVRYRHQRLYDVGDAVTLPHPVSITLDTEELTNYTG
ncbi:Uma2 family endonuclease [Streptomyces arboris]|uniref:Uma2 family endonuclease n=1 Tax=Streptomyces arboris TaxID=2600619 RepID=A0A5N5EF94_9ACTN|nr:Uma2 family endonuclease [Streptomyces arboris]KAB2589476.1 Uma2 family endonuclease [Streptomyces arboris]